MEPRYIVEAKALLGEKEIKGSLANEKIKELFKDAGHPQVVSDETPWCAAFVGACLARANLPKTGSLVARDYLNYGDKLPGPKKNAIGIMKRGNSTWEGHVGFVVDFDKDNVWMLGGNQSNSVSIAKFPRSKFLGFRAPKEKTPDVTKKEVVAASTRMSTQTWLQRIYLTGSAAVAGIWTFAGQIIELAKDNIGVVLLGVLGFGWLTLRLIDSLSMKEYAEGRYLPSGQWKDED